MYDYDTLTGAKSVEGSIKWWGNHSKVPSTQILYEAQAWIYSRIRVWQMIVTTPVALMTGESSIALPGDFQAIVELKRYGDAEPLPFVHENLLRRFRNPDGTLISARSMRYTNLGALEFDTASDADYDFDFAYYATPENLGPSNQTNWLTTGFPTIVRLACTGLAFQDRKRHAEAIDYLKLAEVEIQNINEGDDLARNTQVLR